VAKRQSGKRAKRSIYQPRIKPPPSMVLGTKADGSLRPVTYAHMEAVQLLRLDLIKQWLESRPLYEKVSEPCSGTRNLVARYLASAQGVLWFVSEQTMQLALGSGEDEIALSSDIQLLMRRIMTQKHWLTVVECLAFIVELTRSQENKGEGFIALHQVSSMYSYASLAVGV
jgi:hypothetical protein